jgi:retinol dehydrogenase-12
VAGVSGEYFYKCKITTPTAEARNDADARKLWEVSKDIAGL